MAVLHDTLNTKSKRVVTTPLLVADVKINSLVA